MAKLGKLMAIGLLAALGIVSWFYFSHFVAIVGSTVSYGLKFFVDLTQIGLIALIFAAFLAPLEALGWWAGWYGDAVEEMQNPGVVGRSIAHPWAINRFVIYLDGIGQATTSYLPDVEEFLNQLEDRLPHDIVLVRGIMPYSAINRTLIDSDRPLSWLWRAADYLQVSHYGSIMGTLTSVIINIRNILSVAVSADKRYGPIYNQGIAQVIYNSLMYYGYEPESRTPITLIGFSGGAQMSLGAVPFLKQTLGSAIEVVSIAGVFSGSTNVLELDHLYHFVGDRDIMERFGPIMFPKRWKIFFLSYWNRAKRKGKVTIMSLGKVGHNGSGSPIDASQFLPDGRSYLQQTLDLITAILQEGEFTLLRKPIPRKPSHYEHYWQAAFNRPDYYPIPHSLDPDLYHPIAPWMGRLILPRLAQRYMVRGIWFEVYHTPPEHQHLIGQIVPLRWNRTAAVQEYVRSVKTDIYFNAEAEYSTQQGMIHPDRLNRWRQVDPLESLAGTRPYDDMIVSLDEPLVVKQINSDDNGDAEATPSYFLLIHCDPVQISGRFYALVRFLEPVVDPVIERIDTAESDRFRVVHFNPASQQFDGVETIVHLPQVVADSTGVCNSTSRAIAQSPLNQQGWYIYGAQDQAGTFVVQAIAPRSLFQLSPEQIIVGEQPAFRYLKQQAWSDSEVSKGGIKSVLLCAEGHQTPLPANPVALWQEGDRALVVHTYGGIGGKKAEPATQGPVYFGHFAYGLAQVIREPITQELQFDIRYYQVYTHNLEGVVAGTLHWSRFLGDRQFGWVGVRPTCDLLIKLDTISEPYDFGDFQRSPLDSLIHELEIMTARYRTGDGTGGTYVGLANNCTQDSNQALYASLKRFRQQIEANPNVLNWLRQEPARRDRFRRLVKLSLALRRQLMPLGTARADWQSNAEMLGLSLEDEPIENILRGLVSWRTIFPRVASDAIAHVVLKHGGSIWVLRTNQIGGDDPNIAPVAPMTF
ncbi:CAAX protease [Pantanalinema rosaneae CENA516]|uniref:CAAX protease n=1 Tax=Pantanalinema rosaneae TaxID=1620701 RepID=UPI003D6FD433